MSLVCDPEFFASELDSPLLRRNNGFVSSVNAKDKCKEAVEFYMKFVPKKYMDMASEDSLISLKSTGKEDIDRIFREDAIRTFSSEKNQEIHVKTLTCCYNIIGDYHQGLGFIVAFLLLFLPSQDVIAMCLYLDSEILKGYFKAQNHAYLRDTRVFDRLLRERDRELSEHLINYTVSGSFCSKWWIGMNLHVMPFQALDKWWITLLSGGQTALFQLALSICVRNRKYLLKHRSAALINEMLRFDLCAWEDEKKVEHEDFNVNPNEPASFYLDIIEFSKSIDIDQSRLEELRTDMAEQIAMEEKQRQEIMNQQSDDDEDLFSMDDWNEDNNDSDD